MRTSRVSLPPFSTFIFDKGDRSDRSATASGSADSEVDELEDDPECASTPARTMVFSPSPPPQSAIPRTPSECSSGSLVPYPPWATGPRRSTSYSVHCSPDYTNCTHSRQTSIAPELRSHSHEAIVPTARELRRRHTDYAEYTYSRQSSIAPSPRPSAREASVPAPAGPSRRPARPRSPSPESDDDARDMASPDPAAPSTPERCSLDAHPPRPASWDSDATTAREPTPTHSPRAAPAATKKRRRDSAPLREEKADRARQYRKRAKEAQVALDQVLPESKRVKPGESYILTMDHAREHIHELNRTIAELTGRLKYHQRAAQDAAEESGDEEDVYEDDVREDELHVAKRSRLA